MWRFISYFLLGFIFGVLFPLYLMGGEAKVKQSENKDDRDGAAFMMGLISGLALLVFAIIKTL